MTTSPHLSVSESLREQALAVLRQRLVTGEIAPDGIYSAAAMAADLGVSNSPVREAMLTLVHEGLMEPVRNRGYRVVALTDKDRSNIYQLRLMLEPAAMAHLALNPSLVQSRYGELARLAELTVRCARDEDLIGHLDSDRQFHLGLIELLDNRQLTQIVMKLRDQTRRYSLRSMPKEELMANSREHAQILDAVLGGRSAEAEQLLIQHLSHLGSAPEQAG